MAVVAIIAVGLGVDAARRRAREYRERALYHQAASHQIVIDANFFLCGYGMPASQLEAYRERRARRAKGRDGGVGVS